MTRILPFALLTVAALAGCSPLQTCLSQASGDLRAIERELDERRANLRYGYSIERVPTQEYVPSFCAAPGGQMVPCGRFEMTTREVRHRINPELERERIALLERQLEREQARVPAAEAQCRATYPE